jgi:hypothetical protein
MPEIKLKPVPAGKMNKAAWCRTRTAELSPDHKAGEGSASLTTADVYLDGELIGSVTAVSPGTADAADSNVSAVSSGAPGSTLADQAAPGNPTTRNNAATAPASGRVKREDGIINFSLPVPPGAGIFAKAYQQTSY